MTEVESSRASAADARDDHSDRQDHTAEQRDNAADRRDQAGNQRDVAANRRDQAAGLRDEAANERDHSAEQSEAKVGTGVTSMPGPDPSWLGETLPPTENVPRKIGWPEQANAPAPKSTALLRSPIAGRQQQIAEMRAAMN